MSVAPVAANVARVRARIAEAAAHSGRPPSTVLLVAVSKTMPATAVRSALDAGITDLGENRVQEALDKRLELGDPRARWHLIGHLQSNKARKALECFDLIQSVDTLELARNLSRRVVAGERPRSEPAAGTGHRVYRYPPLPYAPLEVLFEVNVAGEATKQGFAPEALLAAARALAGLEGLAPRGLMTVAPAAADAEAVRPVFRDLRELRERLREVFGPGFSELSMGMSHDYPVAVEEGATMVRVGTAIFGPRPNPPGPHSLTREGG